MKDFKEKLALVPTLPGSYQMKNKDGVIIYVGKAKNLQKRLKSYFIKNQTGKTKMLVEDIDDFEYIVTSSELESLILEITLIKKYNPKYNILLRDDKSYPYIEVTQEKYPVVKVVRNAKRKKIKANLFGPYPNASAARRTVEIINRLYPLRKCNNLGKELCLYYHMHECLGYCKYKIDEKNITEMTEEIKSFLRGNDNITDKLKNKMEEASQNMNYERALEYKLMIDDINVIHKKQKIDLNNNLDFDIINYYYDNNYLSIEVFFVRNGLLFGRHNEIINTLDDPVEEVIEYLIKFYDSKGLIPKELVVSEEFDIELLSEYFNIKVNSPSKGKIKKLVDLARENALEQYKLKIESIENDDKKRMAALNELKDLLGLDNVSRMESFDNSHLFGTYYVGGMVVYENFLPMKDDYRKFKLDVSVKDDLAAMKEVLYRRYFKVLMGEEKAPDLIVLDGGRNQISVCNEILDSLNLDIPVIGLVKNDKHRTNQIMNKNYELLDVKKDTNLFIYLTRIQDEVHRFAISYHRNIKSKGALSSRLDLIPGIGEVRRKELLKKFGSLKKMKEASLEELCEVVPEDVAKKIIDSLE
jgi:excinuclease ABC subunit C